ncbi:VOC family protein [Hydrogenophaga sp.]|uniref:VOC family protein n=1 Tax=Hydrogenophaga sp. TaxID=1904254 RepID=UPI0027179FF3|nr:VOC family protein [Hydrogenophaga sp.]MDO9436847.1 VOC family protein [Hydrogenophaga sp.]
MKPHITVITLGVDDLERAVAFYRDGLGLSTKGIIGTEMENGAVAFFNLQSGLKLALWPRRSLAADTGLPLLSATPQASSALELSIGHNVDSRDAVDAVMRQATEAGARIVKPAQETFYGGYAGYFQDPDGHVWEAAFNPGLDDLG